MSVEADQAPHHVTPNSGWNECTNFHCARSVAILLELRNRWPFRSKHTPRTSVPWKVLLEQTTRATISLLPLMKTSSNATISECVTIVMSGERFHKHFIKERLACRTVPLEYGFKKLKDGEQKGSISLPGLCHKKKSIVRS